MLSIPLITPIQVVHVIPLKEFRLQLVNDGRVPHVKWYNKRDEDAILLHVGV